MITCAPISLSREERILKLEKDYYVYILIRLDKEEPFYVGKGKDNRISRHRTDTSIQKNKNKYMCNIINKLWKNGFNFIEKKLFDNLTENDALDIETRLIAYYREHTNYKLCNISSGGLPGSGVRRNLFGSRNPFYNKQHSNESKERMSKWKKDHYIANGNPFYGKKHSLETKLKIVQSQGKLNIEHIRNIIELLKMGFGDKKIIDTLNLDVCTSTIRGVSNGKRYRNITEGILGIVNFPIRNIKGEEYARK